MPALGNAKWERFAQAIANGYQVTDAYLWAGYSDAHVGPESSRLHKKPHIQKRIAELIAEQAAKDRKDNQHVLQKNQLTREYVITRLVSNVERAMQAEPVLDREGNETGVFKYEGSVANRALELLGKELGMFVDRKEVGVAGEFAAIKSAEELRALIVERLRLAAPSSGPTGPARIEGEVRSKTNRLC